jgi:hypothetical protein
LSSAQVPAPFRPAFEFAESLVKGRFKQIRFQPERGTIHIADERYVLLRAESLYFAMIESLSTVFGADAAAGFVYATAREIGRSDCRAFSDQLGLADGVARLASGPVHFAHAGWAFVEIFDDSAPAQDDSYFLHYCHPNTFETEVLASQKRTATSCACLFSAGYSAGWCSHAFGLEVDAREINCLARGDKRCEFIMAPPHRLDEHSARILAGRS